MSTSSSEPAEAAHTVEARARAIAQALGLGPTLRVDPLPPGNVNQVVCLRRGRGGPDVVIKWPNDRTSEHFSPDAYLSADCFYRHLAQSSTPVPRWSAVLTEAPGPAIAMDLMPGASLADLWPALDDASRASAIDESARALARIHREPCNEPAALAVRGPIARADARTGVDRILARITEDRLVEPSTPRRLPGLLHEAASAFPLDPACSLLHFDFRIPNLLVTRSSSGTVQLTGIIDAEAACLGVPESDIAALFLWDLADRPDLRQRFCRAYVEVSDLAPGYELRLLFWRIIRALSYRAWALMTSDTGLRHEAESALRRAADELAGGDGG